MRHLLGSVAAAAMLVMGLATGAVSADKIVLKVGHDSGVTHPHQKGMEKFKEVLEAETKGAVEVQIFPNAQLGDETKLVEGIRLGSVDAANASMGNIAPFVSEVDLFNLPFIFRDAAHAYKVLDGPVGQRIAKAMEAKAGVVFLGWSSVDFRTMWNSKRPIRSPADLKGLKMRVQASPIMIDTFNALGAQATPLSFAELYNALQQKVVDGADNGVGDILEEKFYEVTKYVSLTNHFAAVVAGLFSKKRFDRLPPDVQQAVLKAGRAASAAQRAAMASLEAGALDEVKKKGLEVYTVDKKPFQEAVEKIYPKYADRVGGAKVIDEVRSQ